MSRTALYRHFDVAGRLLYVGISLSAVHRLTQHRTGSPWFNEIAKITIEWFASRTAALDAELVAIRTEHPAWNKAGQVAGVAPLVATQPAASPPPSWIVLHLESGLYDGFYSRRDDAEDVRDMFREEFPRDSFETVAVPSKRGDWHITREWLGQWDKGWSITEGVCRETLRLVRNERVLRMHPEVAASCMRAIVEHEIASAKPHFEAVTP